VGIIGSSGTLAPSHFRTFALPRSGIFALPRSGSFPCLLNLNFPHFFRIVRETLAVN
jgi:hypothetical protein